MTEKKKVAIIAGLPDRRGDKCRRFAQMDVAGHKLGEGIDDGHDRLGEVFRRHAGGSPQGPRRRHATARCGGSGSQFRHVRPVRQMPAKCGQRDASIAFQFKKTNNMQSNLREI